MPETEPPAPGARALPEPVIEAPSGETSRLSLIWLVPLARVAARPRRRLARLFRPRAADRDHLPERRRRRGRPDRRALPRRQDRHGREDRALPGPQERHRHRPHRQVAGALPRRRRRSSGWCARASPPRASPASRPCSPASTSRPSGTTTLGAPVDRFEGLPRPPLTPADEPGIRIRLRAPDGGSMTIGAPVLFKRIQVGKVEDIQLTEAGDVMIDLFIGAPNNVRLTEATRFWNASGFSIQLGGGGASLNVDSLISLLQGGISFDTVGSDLTPVENGHVYELYPSETAARQNLFEDEPGERLVLDTDFDGSVRGLQPGAPVEYNGIRIGEVKSLQAAIINEEGQPPRVTLRATLALVPNRLGITGTETSRRPRAGARPPRLPGRPGPPRPARRLRPPHPDPLRQPRHGAGRRRPPSSTAPPSPIRACRAPPPTSPTSPPPPRACCSGSPSFRSRTWWTAPSRSSPTSTRSSPPRASARRRRTSASSSRTPASSSARRASRTPRPSSPPSSPRPGRWSTRRPRSSSSPTSTPSSPPRRPRSPASAPPPTACPRSSTRSRRLSAKANALPLDELVASATRLVTASTPS